VPLDDHVFVVLGADHPQDVLNNLVERFVRHGNTLHWLLNQA
jgi:hypothetical protein